MNRGDWLDWLDWLHGNHRLQRNDWLNRNNWLNRSRWLCHLGRRCHLHGHHVDCTRFAHYGFVNRRLGAATHRVADLYGVDFYGQVGAWPDLSHDRTNGALCQQIDCRHQLRRGLQAAE